MDQQQDGQHDVQPEAHKRRKGRWRFTLRELLVIVALGSVLSGWVAVKVRRTTRDCGERVTQVVAKGNFSTWNIGLAIDEQGYPHISYVEFTPHNGSLTSDGDGRCVKYSMWNGSGWVPRMVVPSGSCSNQEDALWSTVIAVDRQGNPCIAISFENIKPLSGNDRHVLAEWNGTDWGIEKAWLPNAGRILALAFDLQGNLHAACNGSDLPSKGEPNFGLYYATRRGRHWDFRRVREHFVDAAALAVDVEGDPHIAYWTGERPDREELTYASWNGSGWTEERGSMQCPSMAYNRRIAIGRDRDNRPRIAFDAGVATRVGSDWEVHWLPSSRWREFTAVALDAAGRPHVCYVENDSLIYACYGDSPAISEFSEFHMERSEWWALAGLGAVLTLTAAVLMARRRAAGQDPTRVQKSL